MQPVFRFKPSACPPADHRKFLRVAKIDPHTKYLFVCYSRAVIGLGCHYHEGRTIACPGPMFINACAACKANVGGRWSAYLVTLAMPSQAPRLLHITPGAYRNCPALEANAGDLRAKWLKVYRIGKSKTSPLKIEVHEEPWDGQFPELPDSAEAVGRLLGIDLEAPEVEP